MALSNVAKTAYKAGKSVGEATGKALSAGTTKSSGAISEDEKRVRWNLTAKEAAKNRLVKSSYAGAGAAVAQAAKMGRNLLRRGR